NPQNKLVHVMNIGDASIGKIIDVEITDTNVSCLKGFYVGAPKNEIKFRRIENHISSSVSATPN
ncbi:MAG: hypothetical protein NT000_01100, partial [Proteobacteria bacterium]|nr:hypothetical protein [Pseudomonadota bacterium]